MVMPEPARSAPSFSTLSSRGPWDPPAPRHQLKSDCFLHGVVRPAWSFSKVSGTVLFVGVLISRQPSVAVVSATPVVPICAALCSSRESCLEAAVSHGQRIHYSNHDWISLQTTAIMISVTKANNKGKNPKPNHCVSEPSKLPVSLWRIRQAEIMHVATGWPTFVAKHYVQGSQTKHAPKSQGCRHRSGKDTDQGSTKCPMFGCTPS